jgi:hypothetical protein
MKNAKMTICLVAAVLVLVASQGFGIEFKDGGTHNIDYTIKYQNALVDYSAPGMRTTVNLVDGGIIADGWFLETFGDSRANISGGSVESRLNAYDNSRVTMSGGHVGDLGSFDNSQVIMSGGSVNSLYAYDHSLVEISGGSVRFSDLYAYGGSRVTISGGSLDICLNSFDSSRVIMLGGSVIDDLNIRGASQITLSGGTIGRNFNLEANANLTIYGSDFAIDGSPVGFVEIASILGGQRTLEPYRRLTGTLANGDIINNEFRIGEYASITLIPEPASLLLLGLGGLLIRKR